MSEQSKRTISKNSQNSRFKNTSISPVKEVLTTMPNTKRIPLSGGKTIGIRSSVGIRSHAQLAQTSLKQNKNIKTNKSLQRLYASVQVTNEQIQKSQYIPVYAEEEEADIIIDDNSPQHLKRHLKKVSFQTNEPLSPSENYISGSESIKNKDIIIRAA